MPPNVGKCCWIHRDSSVSCILTQLREPTPAGALVLRDWEEKPEPFNEQVLQKYSAEKNLIISQLWKTVHVHFGVSVFSVPGPALVIVYNPVTGTQGVALMGPGLPVWDILCKYDKCLSEGLGGDIFCCWVTGDFFQGISLSFSNSGVCTHMCISLC